MLLRRRVEDPSTRTPCGFLALPRSPNAASGHFPSREQPENHAECDQTYQAAVSERLHQRHDVVRDVAEEWQVGAAPSVSASSISPISVSDPIHPLILCNASMCVSLAIREEAPAVTHATHAKMRQIAASA